VQVVGVGMRAGTTERAHGLATGEADTAAAGRGAGARATRPGAPLRSNAG
jgi:hypothetical protein